MAVAFAVHSRHITTPEYSNVYRLDAVPGVQTTVSSIMKMTQLETLEITIISIYSY